MTKNKKKIFVWSSDCFENTGEGKLAILYLKYLYRNLKNIGVETPYNKFTLRNNYKFPCSNKINFSYYLKYLSPIIGIFKLWQNYFKNKKVIYLNYLPLWNSFIIFLSPPGTIFGPVTGSTYGKNISDFSGILRKFFFPIIYKINSQILFFRKNKILFSTSLLKKIISKKKINKCIFDFQALYLYKKKIINSKKSKSLLIYYRKHSNKKYNLHSKIVNKFSKHKIYIFGDHYKDKSVRNYGIINKKKLNYLFQKSGYAIAGLENYASFFILDCYLNNIILIERSKIFTGNKVIGFKLIEFPINLRNTNINRKYYKVVVNQKNLENLNYKANDYFKSLC